MGGVEEGVRISPEHGIECIRCIEINTHYEGYDFHLWGYFIDHRDQGILWWLKGLEAYSSYHEEEDEPYFKVVSERYGLLVTAESDFHGREIKPDVRLGGLGGRSYDLVERLRRTRRARDKLMAERLRVLPRP